MILKHQFGSENGEEVLVHKIKLMNDEEFLYKSSFFLNFFFFKWASWILRLVKDIIN